jgi:hypothetical protein
MFNLFALQQIERREVNVSGEVAAKDNGEE